MHSRGTHALSWHATLVYVSGYPELDRILQQGWSRFLPFSFVWKWLFFSEHLRPFLLPIQDHAGYYSRFLILIWNSYQVAKLSCSRRRQSVKYRGFPDIAFHPFQNAKWGRGLYCVTRTLSAEWNIIFPLAIHRNERLDNSGISMICRLLIYVWYEPIFPGYFNSEIFYRVYGSGCMK